MLRASACDSLDDDLVPERGGCFLSAYFIVMLQILQG